MIALIIFLFTIFCIIFRPFGLGIGTYAVIGAVLSLIFKQVSFNDCLSAFSIVWDASLSFLGIIIFSLVLDEIGFFEHAARQTALLCGASLKRQFIGLMLLTAVISALFANDAAVLILSPIILAQAKMLNLSQKSTLALLLATGFMSDSASLPFVFSNLTNIITAGFFGIGFWQYFEALFAPFIFSVFSSLMIAFWILRQDLSAKLDLNALRANYQIIANKHLFIFCWIFLAVLLFGYALGDLYHLPFCVFALGGALVFLGICLRLGALKIKVIFARTPWQILWFSLALYIIVWGLKNAGYNEILSELLKASQKLGELSFVMLSGLFASILSSFMNNLPAMMMMDISLADVGHFDSVKKAVFASIIGCNVGVKFTHFGSLATLLWLYTLRAKGQNISIKSYLIFSFKITLPVIFFTLFGVYLFS